MKKKSIFVMLLLAICLVTVTGCKKDKKVLATPEVTITESIVTWNKIANCNEYEIKVNEKVTSVTTNSFKLDSYGKFIISVRAISNSKKYVNSKWSKEITIDIKETIIVKEKLETPIVDKLDYQTIEWLLVVDASGYNVYSNDVLVAENITENKYSIKDLEYGVHSLRVVAISSNSDFDNSDKSEAVILEKIDPKTIAERISIVYSGSKTVFIGDSLNLEFSLQDKNNADISFIEPTFTTTVTKGSATIDEKGVFTSNEAGTVEVTVILNEYEKVKLVFEIEVVKRATVSGDLKEYDKEKETSMKINASTDGKLYFLNLNALPKSIEELISNPNVKTTEVKKGENNILLPLGAPSGDSLNIYFVLESKIDDKVVGFSEIFALEKVHMDVIITTVTNVNELIAAITENVEYIKLANDISAGAWARINVSFTGVLDGDGHAIKNLLVTGGGTGMIKTLGNGCKIINIKFVDCTATDFSGSSNGIVAYSVDEGAQVAFENFEMINCQAISNIEGSSRSTHGGVIAKYENELDTTVSISFKNCYIQYSHLVTRKTQTANIGALLGAYTTASANGLILENVYVDANTVGIFDNSAAIIGKGAAIVTMKNVVVNFEMTKTIPGGYKDGIVFGYIVDTTTFNTTVNAENTILLTQSAKARYDFSKTTAVVTKTIADVSETQINEFLKNDAWSVEDNTLTLTVLGQKHKIRTVKEIEKVNPKVNGTKITWDALKNATMYEIIINKDQIAFIQDTAYDLASLNLAAGTYQVKISAYGTWYLTRNDVTAFDVVVPLIELDSPNPIYNESENTITWDAIDNAIEYQIFANEQLIATTKKTSFSCSDFEKGTYSLEIIAIADKIRFANSAPSLVINLEITVDPLPRIESPVITINDHVLTITQVESAVGYDIYFDDKVVINNTKETSIDLSSYFDSYNKFNIHVVAKSDGVSYRNSLPSNLVEDINYFIVSSKEDLTTLFTNNYNFAKLANDIDATDYEMYLATFNGTLNGNGYCIKNLVLENGFSAFIYCLGHNSVIKNLTIKDGIINAQGGKIAFLAVTVEKGANILIENVALENCVTNVADTSSSTQGGLIANYEGIDDKDLMVTIKNCYVNFIFNATNRTKKLYNVGAIFGTFKADASNVILDNVFVNTTFIGKGKYGNAAVVIGNGGSQITYKNTLISLKSEEIDDVKFDTGYKKCNKFEIENTIFYSNNNSAFTNELENNPSTNESTLTDESIQTFANNSNFNLTEGSLEIKVNGVMYKFSK